MLKDPQAGIRALREYGATTGVCSAVVACMMWGESALVHWFVLPVLGCGALLLRDALDVFRREEFVFQPSAMIGLLGLHLFFVAPLLHVYTNTWLTYVVPPDDWRPWLGLMACWNLLGLIVYKFCAGAFDGGGLQLEQERQWRPQPRSVAIVGLLAIALSLGAAVFVQVSFGGLLGIVDAVHARPAAFEGMGLPVVLGEALPTLGLGVVLLSVHERGVLRSGGAVFALLAVFFIVLLIGGALRGSRSALAWGMFWAVGAIHLYHRRMPRSVLLGIATVGVVFLYVAGFYKAAGLEGLKAAWNTEERRELAAASGRTADTLLLNDLARSDVQAYVLYQLWRHDSDYEYALGRTYLGTAALLIPRSIWPERPPTKVKEGTQVLQGANVYDPGVTAESRVFGLAGEAMLNFGHWGLLPAFAAFGMGLGFLQRLCRRLGRDDPRQLLRAVAVNLCVVVLVGDSDNVLGFLAQWLPVCALILLTCSPRREPAPCHAVTRA